MRFRSLGHNCWVLGPAIIVIVLVIVIPVAVCVSGAAVAWIFGWSLRDDADRRNEGTEYVELGK